MKKIAICLLFSLLVVPVCSCSSFKKTNSDNYPIIPLVGENEATDHGVIVQPNSRCINLLNWKTTDEYAPKSLNKGSRITNNSIHSHAIIPGVADAQLDLENGVMITTCDMPNLFPMDTPNAIFGNKSFHTCDYWFYYVNLRENGLKRIESFLEREPK